MASKRGRGSLPSLVLYVFHDVPRLALQDMAQFVNSLRIDPLTLIKWARKNFI